MRHEARRWAPGSAPDAASTTAFRTRSAATGSVLTVDCWYNSTMTKEDYFEQGVNAFGDEKLDESIEMYKKALELDPSYQDALHGLGMALHKAGRFDEAIAAARRLVEIDPDDILAHTSLSMSYQAQGRIEDAEKEGNAARILGWKQELRKENK